jgi:DNA-binding SARP family transcriptional activator
MGLLKDKRIPIGLHPEADQLAMQVNELNDQIPEYRRILRQQGLVISLEKIPKITIQTLGSTQVSLDGNPVSVPEWRVQKVVRELFFLLLANPDGLSKEEIGLILWPESSDQKLKIQFKNAIYRLRRALGKGVVVFDSTSDTYKFNWSIDYDYDVEKFRNLIDRANKAPGPEKYLAFEAAVKLYQGVYLHDGEGVWINPEREQLWQMYLKAELALADHALLEGEYHAALAHIHRVLSHDSCQEEAHRLAMRTYAAMGNQADLIRQYEVCKSALNGVFGIQPSKRTEDLFMELLTGNQL